MSYGANLAALPRETAVYVDKILKGSKPAELPVARPAKFRFGDQSEVGQGAWDRHSANAARARRRGD
jgi:hypothetical protein